MKKIVKIVLKGVLYIVLWLVGSLSLIMFDNLSVGCAIAFVCLISFVWISEYFADEKERHDKIHDVRDDIKDYEND